MSEDSTKVAFVIFWTMFCLGCSTAVQLKTQNGVSLCDQIKDFPSMVGREVETSERQKSVGFGLAIFNRKTEALECESYFNPDLPVYPASTIKILIAFAALKKIDENRGNLDTLLKITQTNANLECQHWNCESYSLNKQRTVGELLADMIVVSNNIAANQLIDWVGKSQINRLSKEIRAQDLKLFHKLSWDVKIEPEIKEKNQATAKSMVTLISVLLASHSIGLRASSRSFMEGLLFKQKYHDRLNSDFPKETAFFHKTGNTSNSSSDAGYFHLDSDHEVILVGLQGFRDFDTLRRVGRRVLDLFPQLHTENSLAYLITH